MIGTKEEKQGSLLENIKAVKWSYVVLCLMAFMLSRINLFNGFYTAGVCYVCAVFFNKQLRKWGILMGVLGLISTGVLDVNILKYVFILVLIFLLRGYIYFTGSEFNIKNQSVVLGVSIFLINIMLSAVSQFKIYDLLIGVLESIGGIGLTVIFSYGTEVIIKNRKTPLTQKEMISMGLLMACILGGMIDFYIHVPVFKSIYFRDIMTFMILIAVTYLGGTNGGITMSVVISVLLVVVGYMPSHFTAVYALSAVAGTLFIVLGRTGVVFASGIGLLAGFALFNNRIIDMQIFGAYLIAGVISLCIPKTYFGLADWFGYSEVNDDEKHLLRVQKIITERLSHFSGAFYNLSRTFQKIADKKVYLDEKDLNCIIEETGEKMCQNCSMKTFCWQDYIEQTYQSAYKMLDLIERKGQLKLGDIPPDFQKSCINAESFACTLGFKLDLFKQNLMWKNRFVESRSLVGQQFEAIAESIGKLCRDIEKEFYFNEEDENLIKEALHAGGIRTRDVMVLENNGRKEEIHIYTYYYKKDTVFQENLVQAVGTALGMRVELEKQETNEEENYLYFKLKLTKSYGILAGAAFHAKGEVSGDVYSFMEVEEGQYLLALADGMGSGKLALEESTATIELLESFMNSGFKNDLTVKIINSVLVLKSDIENFSTMDITLIDEYTGAAEFLKMGAAASFILRNKEVMTIQSNTLPIGIIDDVDIEVCRKQLKDGDVIIMVTDGMLQGENMLLGKEDTFKQFILEADSDNPSYMAEYLIKKSRDLLGNADNDDMTVVAARIWKRN